MQSIQMAESRLQNLQPLNNNPSNDYWPNSINV